MKRLILVILSVLFAVVSFAQSVPNVSTNYKLDVDDELTYLRYIGSAADTISNNDSTWTYSIGILNVFDAMKVEARVELDSVSGSPQTAAYLKGKTFAQDSWTTLTTVNWVNGSDTTFYLSYSTAKPYRFYQIAFDCVADSTQKFKVDEFEISLYK